MGVKNFHSGGKMDTFKIKLVLAAARCKSFSRAAEEFSYTPSALSHTVSAFEDSLGVIIFKRSSTGVELTSAGEALMPLFNSVLESEAELTRAAAAMAKKQRSELRIASYSSISRNYLTGIVKEFRKREPDIELSINVVDDLSGWLEEGRADIVFADRRILSGCNFVPIMEDVYFVIAPPDWFPNRTSIDLSELYEYPYIDANVVHTDNGYDPAKFKERISFKSEDDLSVINMVREGMGVSVLPELVLKKNLDGVSVMSLEPKITRTLGFAAKEHKHSQALAKFIKFIKS